MKELMIVMTAAMVLAGCGKNEAAKSADAKKSEDAVVTITDSNRTYFELGTNDVVVRVNGAELTKGEIERQIEFRIAMAKLRPMTKMNAQREAKMRHDMLRTCDQQFIMQELMKRYAETNGVKVSGQDRVAMREKLVKTYARGGSYRKLVKGLTYENKAILGEGVERELCVQKGREKLIANNLRPIGDSEVAQRRAYFEKYNERARAILAKTWLDATNVWKKAVGGYPFEKLVSQYENGDVEHISSDSDWGDLKASDYRDDKELYRILTTTPEGAIPPPFEGDNGLLVVKILKITPADADNKQGEPLYRLAKIFFELPEIWEVETDAEIQADLEKIHQREAFQKGIKALVNASKIEYPCGTNLFPRAKAKFRKPIPAAARRRLPRNVKLPE